MGTQSDREAVRARVYGRVQGVGFRYFVQKHASRLNLSGWVRNEPDGESVELIAQGPRTSVERLLALVEQGPPGAIVERVETEWITRQDQHHRFEIRR